ncbi:type 1 glutamine amidotransferase domain-containing protein [Roseateles sp. NT4]|uniref:type 1 glutamine amidotransferase domain-containing protein n=1 Tax=Roseateles sp. NT4 TaxID=3453715 RepID=UPI003EE9F9DE
MRALFVTTSASQLAPGHPTGLWLEEFAVPYLAVTEAGITVTVSSPLGGPVPLDPKTAPTDEQRDTWARPLEALQHSATLASVKDETYDAIFIPGGHGPMVDLARNATLHALVSRHDAAGKVIAAVCHGPAALVHASRTDGQPFFKGRRATGFTNAEEFLARLKDVVPFLLQDEMEASGADFHSALLPLLSHVEQDGKLITGQNPNSSEAVAQALVAALSGH